jgi:TPR repeat protein
MRMRLSPEEDDRAKRERDSIPGMGPPKTALFLISLCACASAPSSIPADGPSVRNGAQVDVCVEWHENDESGRMTYELWQAATTGEGLPQDEELARSYLNESAERGYAPAIRELAWRRVQEGSEGPPGREALERLGTEGDVEAAFYAASLRREGGELDEERYWEAVGKLALHGSTYARRALAKEWRTRSMGRWWLRELAAEGDADAAFEIGRSFETGDGLPRDRRQAFEWYSRPYVRRSARQADAMMRTYDPAPDPRYSLFPPHYDIDDLALDMQHPLAMYWLGVAWARIDAEDEGFNGDVLIRRAAASGSCPLAVRWLAERFGRSPGSTAESKLRYAECLEYGWGFDRTPETRREAARWYAEAARMGSDEAAYAGARLTLLHATDLGLDPREAGRRARGGFEAAVMDSPSAACALGLAHSEFWMLDRLPDDRSPALCVRWLRRAAREGHARAQFELGRCHERGYGVPRDVEAARDAYAKAAQARYLPEEPGPDDLLDDVAGGPVRIAALLAYGRLGLDHDVTKPALQHAVACIRMAWDEGAGAPAAALLARAYADGRGVPRDAAVSAAWRRQAGAR